MRWFWRRRWGYWVPTFGACAGATVVIALESVAILLAVALVYRLTLPESTQVFFGALGNFFSYGKNLIDPPWVFHSPVGDRLTRRVWLIAATAIVTMLVATLTMSQGLQLWFPTSPRSLAIRFAVLSFIVPGMVAPLLVVVGAFVATAPTLVAYHRALEAKYGHEQHLEWTDFDGYVDRLRTSNNAIEARSNIIGFHPIWEFPVLADTDLYFEHQHVLGSTGTGKTRSLGHDRSHPADSSRGWPGDRRRLQGRPSAVRDDSDGMRAMRPQIQVVHQQAFPFDLHLQSAGTSKQSAVHAARNAGRAAAVVQPVSRRRVWAGLLRQGGSHSACGPPIWPPCAPPWGVVGVSTPHATGYRAERIESFWDLDDILQEITANDRGV